MHAYFRIISKNEVWALIIKLLKSNKTFYFYSMRVGKENTIQTATAGDFCGRSVISLITFIVSRVLTIAIGLLPVHRIIRRIPCTYEWAHEIKTITGKSRMGKECTR